MKVRKAVFQEIRNELAPVFLGRLGHLLVVAGGLGFVAAVLSEILDMVALLAAFIMFSGPVL